MIMAVTAVVESKRGTGLSGEYGRPVVLTRRFAVRVDSPTTPQWQILNACGVYFASVHPEFAGHLAMDVDLSEASGDGIVWDVQWRYTIPPPDNTPNPDTGLPRDYWHGNGGTKTIAVYKDKDGDELTNSAGDPLEGAERESAEFSLTLTKFYADTSWSALAEGTSNTVNASAWNLGAARTWKVAFKGVQKRVMTSVVSNAPTSRTFWETTWEFCYRSETWDWQPWDIGFNQLVQSDGTPSASGSKRAAILGADKKPVKSPVALAGGVAKTPGQKPDALQFRLYKESDFSVFGTPG